MKKIFIDLGSFDGDTIEQAIKIMPNFDEFIGFEPVKELDNKAVKKYKDNPKVKLLNVAAGLEDKKIDFNVDIQKEAGTTEYTGSTMMNDKITGVFIKRKVKSINFPKWLKDNVNKDDFVILKIDIEGFEYDLIERLLEENVMDLVNVLYVEWHWKKVKSITEERHNNLITKLKTKRFDITGSSYDEFGVLANRSLVNSDGSKKKINIIYARGSDGIQFNKIANEGTKTAMERGWIKRITAPNNGLVKLEHIDKPVDIYHCHSAHSLQGIKKAKELGAVTILQRDSSHVLSMIEWCEEGNTIWRNKYPQCCSDLRARTNLDLQLGEYEEADYILLASGLEKQSFIDRGVPEQKIKKIPFAVDFNKFKPLNKQHEFGVVLGGGESIRKGYPEANEVCKKANVPLHIVPNHPRGADFMVNELNKYDVCLATTREDGYPCLVQEAMACGLVPIVSNRNGVKDLIKNGVNGYVISLTRLDTTIKKIAVILTFLKDNPCIRKEMGLRAREAVSKRTWEDYGNNIAKFYEEIIRGKK